MTAPADIPDAWPALLDKQLAAAFVRLSADTFDRICPVAPVDLGVHLLRWRRVDLEAWLAALPSRLRRAQLKAQDAAPQPEPVTDPAEERRLSAVERARSRGEGAWKIRSRTSRGSGEQTAA